MSECIEGLECIEELEVIGWIGWIVWRDGREPRRNGHGILFTDHAEAVKRRGWLDTCEPVTAERLAELRRRFGGGSGSGR